VPSAWKEVEEPEGQAVDAEGGADEHVENAEGGRYLAGQERLHWVVYCRSPEFLDRQQIANIEQL